MRKRSPKHNSKQAVTPKKRPLLSTKTVKRYLGISELLAPVLIPVLFKGIASTREFLQDTRAKKLGVPPEKIGSYFGMETKQKARLYNLENSLDKLANQGYTDKDFIQNTRNEINKVSLSLQAVSKMSAENRKPALTAIAEKIDGLEAKTVRALGL